MFECKMCHDFFFDAKIYDSHKCNGPANACSMCGRETYEGEDKCEACSAEATESD